jgi:predicted acylesterase/phospholipase RssA
MHTKKSALVLSGGGALGVAHIGVIKNLEEKNYQFDFLVGISAGAIVTSALAIGLRAEEIWNLLNDKKLFRLAFDASKTNFGLISGDKILEKLEEIFGDTRIEDLETSLYIGATNFETGARHTFNTGKITHAIRASLSVPVLFNPYFHPEEKTWFVDGGLSQNFPLDIALEQYAGKKIIGIDVAGGFPIRQDFHQEKTIKKISHLTKTLERTFRIIFKNQQQYFPPDPRVTILRPDLSQFKSVNPFKIRSIYQAGIDHPLEDL